MILYFNFYIMWRQEIIELKIEWILDWTIKTKNPELLVAWLEILLSKVD